MIDRLHYISQQTPERDHVQDIEAALRAGCRWIQFRMKHAPERVVLQTAFLVRELCTAYQATLIINDFPRVALAVKADGVHLGLSDLPVNKARQLLGPHCIIGGTANTVEDVLLRVSEGANYIGLGPLRFTTTKEKLSPLLGMNGYRKILQRMRMLDITLPVIAIGGVLPEDISELLSAGVHGVAVSGAIAHALHPSQTVGEMYAALQVHDLTTN